MIALSLTMLPYQCTFLGQLKNSLFLSLRRVPLYLLQTQSWVRPHLWILAGLGRIYRHLSSLIWKFMTMDFKWPWAILLPDKHPSFHIHLLSQSLGRRVDFILNLLILLQPRAQLVPCFWFHWGNQSNATPPSTHLPKVFLDLFYSFCFNNICKIHSVNFECNWLP